MTKILLLLFLTVSFTIQAQVKQLLSTTDPSGIYVAQIKADGSASIVMTHTAEYKSMFALDDNGKVDLNEVTYYVSVSGQPVLKIKATIDGIGATIKTTYTDEQTTSFLIPFMECKEKEAMYVYDQQLFYVILLKPKGILLINFPIEINGQKALLHLQPRTRK